MGAVTELMAELRKALEERDEARSALAACPDCAMWAERSARWHDDMQRAERERDEALARCGTLRELADAAAYEQGLAQRRMMDAQRERDEARAEIERLRTDRDKWRDRYHAMRTDVGLSGDIDDEVAASYRRGVDAMREACIEEMRRVFDEFRQTPPTLEALRRLRALPIPEES